MRTKLFKKKLEVFIKYEKYLNYEISRKINENINNILYYRYFNYDITFMNSNMILQFNLDRLKSKDFQLFSIIISYPSFALPCLNSSILKYIYQKYNITLKQLKVYIETKYFTLLTTNSIALFINKLVFVKGLVVKVYKSNYLTNDKSDEILLLNQKLIQLYNRDVITLSKLFSNTKKNKSILISSQKIIIRHNNYSIINRNSILDITAFIYDEFINTAIPSTLLKITGIFSVSKSKNSFIPGFNSSTYTPLISTTNITHYNEKNEEIKKIKIQPKIINSLLDNKNYYYSLINMILPSSDISYNIKKGLILLLYTPLKNDGLKINQIIKIAIMQKSLIEKRLIIKFIHSNFKNLASIIEKKKYFNLKEIEKKFCQCIDNIGNIKLFIFDFIYPDLLISSNFFQEILSYTKITIPNQYNNFSTNINFSIVLMMKYKPNKINAIVNNINEYYLQNLFSNFDLIYFARLNNFQHIWKSLSIDDLINVQTNLHILEKKSINEKTLRYSIYYTKTYISPNLPKTLLNQSIKLFMKVRNAANNRKLLKISIRFIETLLKISALIAKLHFCNIVEISHLKEAVRITLSNSLKIKNKIINKLNISTRSLLTY